MNMPTGWALLMLCGLLSIGACTTTTTVTSPSSGTTTETRGPIVPDANEDSEERRRARIRTELATGYYQQRNMSVALDELRQAIAADGSYAPAFGLLGLIYMDLRENSKADESFQRALKLAPNDSELNNNYGWFLCQTERSKQSFDYFIRATRNPLYPTPDKPLHNAGICALRAGDETLGETYLKQSFQANSRNPVAMFQLSEFYLKRNDLRQASLYSRRLLSMYDPNAEALWLALRVERRNGDREAEARFSSQLRRRFPESRETAMLLSGQYER
jgi:type IV pilus assembly protein PilF